MTTTLALIALASTALGIYTKMQQEHRDQMTAEEAQALAQAHADLQASNQQLHVDEGDSAAEKL